MSCCKNSTTSQISDDQLLLFIMFKQKKRIEIHKEFIIKNKKFVYLSHVQEFKDEDNLKYIAHFIYQDSFLHQINENILLSNVEEMKENVKFLVYAKNVEPLFISDRSL